MIYSLILMAFLLSVFLSLILIPRILIVAFRKRLFDLPSDRKIHTGAIPRLGGLSFVPTILFSLAFTTAIRYMWGYEITGESLSRTLPEFYLLVCGLTLLYLAGIKDDLVGLRYRAKFAIQIIAASFFPLSGLMINNLYGFMGIYALPLWLGIPFTIFIVVFITNAINLIDGIDGLASGLCCISLAVLGFMHITKEHYMYAFLALATQGVLIPFWFYNVFGNARRGRKIFMGDAGSLTLGYILSFLVIHLSMSTSSQPAKGGSDMVIAFSTLLVPTLDVIRVVFHRLRTGKNPFLPDKNHFHHKLLRTGMRVRMVMVTILFVSLFFIGLNLLLMRMLNVTFLLVMDLIVWCMLHWGINWRIGVYEKKKVIVEQEGGKVAV